MKSKILFFLIIEIIFIQLLFSTNLNSQCVINITDGSLGNKFVYTKIENCVINVSTRLNLIGQVEFKNCNFIMGTGSEINMHTPIRSGPNIIYRNRVTLENCTLTKDNNSGDYWNGINVAAGSYLKTIGTTAIKRAKNGLNIAWGANCSIKGTTFFRNEAGINIPNNDIRFNVRVNSNVNLTDFSGNDFDDNQIGVKLNNYSLKINIGKNAATVNTFEGNTTGIYVKNTLDAVIENCKFDIDDIDIDILNTLANEKFNATSCTIVGLGKAVKTFSYYTVSAIRVRGNWQSVDISNSMFEQLGKPKAIDIENINNGDFIIKNNTFKYIHNSGQESAIVSVLNSSGLDKPIISDNIFLESAGGFSFSIQLTKVYANKILVSLNKLYGLTEGEPSQKTFCSFHSDNCNNVNFLMNESHLINNGGVQNPWTMHQIAGKKCTFSYNKVINQSTTNRESIRLEGTVEDDHICRNTVANSFKGILLVNNAPGTKIEANKITGDGPMNNQIGLQVLGNIPNQNHTGNHWIGGSFALEGFLESSLIISQFRNRFLSRDDNYNKSEKYWPTKVNRNDWFIDDKTVENPLMDCSILPSPSGTPNCNMNEANKYLYDSDYRNSLSQGELWDSDSYFYNIYSENPTCLTSIDQISLFNSIDASNLSDFFILKTN